MAISVRQKLTLEAYKEFMRLHYFRRNWKNLVFFLFIPFSGLYLFYSKLKEYTFTEFMLNDSFYFMLGWVLILFPYLYFRLLMRGIANQFKKGTLGDEMVYDFTEEGFVITTKNGNSHKTLWSNIPEVSESENLFLIFIEKNTAHLMEKKQMSPEAVAQLRQLLHQVKGLKIDGR